jgi:outer membrane receptor for ferric coprogen and ferric-rhodotorulic acid
LGREHERVEGGSAFNAHWKGKDYGSPKDVNGNVVDYPNLDENVALDPCFQRSIAAVENQGFFASEESLETQREWIVGRARESACGNRHTRLRPQPP